MSSRVAKMDTGAGVSLITSAVIHLAVFLLLVWWGRMFPQQVAVQETYYVDVVNLPAADHHSGSPALKPVEAEPLPVPAPTSLKTASKAIAKESPRESTETESAFDERMARLERRNEARHEATVLEKLRRKVTAGSGPSVVTPGTGGAGAGSRYGDYIKSRLEDALKVTSSYTTKNPEVVVRLTIGADGKLMSMKIERSSGDAAFELSVRRAIDLASEKFTAPPNRSVFENGFVFKPKSISNKAKR